MTVRGACLLALIATVSVACDTPAPQRRPQGLQAGEETPRGPVRLPNTAPQSAPAAPPSSLPSPFMGKAPNPGALSNPDAAVQEAPTATTTEARDAAPPRNLGSELRILLGQPASCLDLAAVAASGGRAVVTATASVVPSGRITRATVTVPGQPSTAVRCLEQRLTSGSLKGPIEGAPRQVSTTIPVEIIAAPPR